MAETNQFGKNVGKHTKEEWDILEAERQARIDEIMKNYQSDPNQTEEEKQKILDGAAKTAADYTAKHQDDWNQYGSSFDYGNAEGNKYVWSGKEGWYDIDNFSEQTGAFEQGQLKWSGLSPDLQDWYLANYDAADIVADIDNDGNTITVADIMPVEPVVDTKPAQEIVNVTPIQETAPGEAPAPVTTTISNPIADKPVAKPSMPMAPPPVQEVAPPAPGIETTAAITPVQETQINAPAEYNYNTYGLGRKPEGTTTGYQPIDTSHLLSTAEKQQTQGQVLAAGNEWVQDPLTGRWVQQPKQELNRGGQVKNFNEGGFNTGTDALDSALGNLESYYSDPANTPAWYGTQYNADTQGFEGINQAGNTLAQHIAAGGDPNNFQTLNPIAGFNENQIAGQDAHINASQAQGQLAQDFGNAVQTGLSGGYGYNPNLQTATTLGAAQGYNPAQQGQADYVNQYLNPAVQQAQQSAIANVNAGFGQGGTLGGARNARAASQAAVQASLPTLAQGAQTEFGANQAINASNASAQNQAAQFGAQNANQFAQQNAGILNQTDAANAGAANQASQYNLGQISNWASQVPQAQQNYLQQGNTLQQVGQQQQDLAQNQTNQDVQAWNYGQNWNAQNLQNQLALGQIGAAAQAGNLGHDVGNTPSSGFDFGNLLNLGIGGGGGDGGFNIGSLFGLNMGGQVPHKQGLLRRRS